MTEYMSAAENGHDDSTDLTTRETRALTERMGVLDDVGVARGARAMYRVVGENGDTYTVDTDAGACTCPDYEYNLPSDGETQCKHLHRVAFATGNRPVPAWVDTDTVDAMLGEHVTASPAVAATDGGSEIVDAGDDAEILDAGDADTDTDERPDDCRCDGLGSGLCCWRCWHAGYRRTPSADD